MNMMVSITNRGSNRTIAAAADPKALVASFGVIKKVETTWKQSSTFGGPDTCAITVAPTGAWVGALFRPGDPMLINGRTSWRGIYSETTYDGTDVVLHGRGYAHALFDYPCEVFTSEAGVDTHYPTRNPLDGIDYPVDELGMPITNVGGAGIPDVLAGSGDGTVPISDLDDPARTYGDVLSEACQEVGLYWKVEGTVLTTYELPTTAVYALDSNAGFFAVADTNYYSDVKVRFLKTGTMPDANLANQGEGRWTDTEGLALYDRRVRPAIDYRPVILDATEADRQITADALAAKLGEKVRGRQIITGSVTLGPLSGLTTVTGGRVSLGFVQSGQRVQVKGARTTQGAYMPDGDATFVIGEAAYSWDASGEESLSIVAIDPAPRDIDQILAPPAAEGGPVEPPP